MLPFFWMSSRSRSSSCCALGSLLAEKVAAGAEWRAPAGVPCGSWAGSSPPAGPGPCDQPQMIRTSKTHQLGRMLLPGTDTSASHVLQALLEYCMPASKLCLFLVRAQWRSQELILTLLHRRLVPS